MKHKLFLVNWANKEISVCEPISFCVVELRGVIDAVINAHMI